MLKFFIGIDPGLDGAIAFYHPESGVIVVADMPTVAILSNKRKKRTVDLHGLVKMLRGGARDNTKAVIEEVSAMPGQGVTSMFNFGWSAGVCHMALAALEVPYTTVPAAKWKRNMRIGKDKEGSRQRASQLFPKYTELWARKKDDGRAEAVLLAYWLAKAEGVQAQDNVGDLM